MGFIKIVLFAGLGVGVLVGMHLVNSVGHYKEEMDKLTENPTRYYREGLLREVEYFRLDLHAAAYRGDREGVLRLLREGRDIDDKKTSFKFTPFHTAIFNGQIETAELLLSKGAKIDEKSNFDQTSLHWAAAMGQEGSARFLIERGVTLDDTSEQGWTAIHFASRMGHINIVKLLVEHGAQKDKKTPEGQSAEDLAKSFDQKEVARYLGSIP